MRYPHTPVIPGKRRGFHLITDEIVMHLPQLALIQFALIQIGLLHLLLMPTSASLTLNKHGDTSVRGDIKAHFIQCVIESESYQHNGEGNDDMLAHTASSFLDTTYPSGNATVGNLVGLVNVV